MAPLHPESQSVPGRTLLLVRHAKSSWENAAVSDFERNLNERGKKDAPAMAKRLLEKKVGIDAILSSPAKRARKTAQIFAEEFLLPDSLIFLKPELYTAPEDAFLDAIRSVDDQFHHLAIFSHNPGITDFVNSLTKTRIDDMPTCGVFAIRLYGDSWKEFKNAAKEFWFFDYPKSII